MEGLPLGLKRKHFPTHPEEYGIINWAAALSCVWKHLEGIIPPDSKKQDAPDLSLNKTFFCLLLGRNLEATPK